MALYKFQTANLNSLTGLKKHSLYFSSLSNFNDATEIMFGLLPDETPVSDNCVPDIEKLKQCSVLCMATDEKDKNVEENLLMWTHYGEQLSGICLVFNELLIKNSLTQNGCTLHQKVVYGYPNVISKSQLVGEHMGIECISGVDFLNINKIRLIKSFIFNKPKCFEYENEYRFISNTASQLIKYNPDSLEKIIFGSKFKSTELKDIFIEVARKVNSNIGIYEARVIENSFRITVEKCL
ncbi:DUF2971 domain-containing protein [Photobacterium piscicola]|uniref:DUF2971 domain-containing protein n=1 Tax=Photobacterium piscicola TaxID=1378299 RepID=A0ABU6LJN5_9GAMM|nr:DUF2971 domain-containing protein [Photobacterium piscicola]